MKSIIFCTILLFFNLVLFGQINKNNETLLTSVYHLTNTSEFSERTFATVYPSDSLKPRGCDNHYYELCPFIITEGVRIIKMQFKNFPELNQSKIDLLNSTTYYMNIGIASYFWNIYGELGTSEGLIFHKKSDYTDSLNIDLTATNSYLTLGYGLTFKKLRTILTPYFSFYRNRYRYTTYRKGKSITISQYFKDTNYDLRFYQWTGVVGLNFDVGHFKEKKNPELFDLSFGTGYLFKFSNNPLIKSARNKITSSGHIDYNNLFLQISCKICFPRI